MADDLAYIKHLADGYDRELVLQDLMENFGEDVWNFAFFLTQRSHVADDIAQEVFLAAFTGMYAFRGECTVKSWLLTITRNKSLHYLQGAFFRKVTLTDRFIATGSSPAAERIVFDRMDNRELWDIVMSLPRKYREVLILDYHYGLKMNEIAELLHVSVGTVKSRLHRAKTKMNALLTLNMEES
ncbi:RNA polymerase sigma-70 factor (ECF subfamily) [Paenibacillus qinlingensis]|uniref:RNA polymerase sigma factor n=1 Tax=Paenibacillus qinlingensis TaxID=1837343 RepID=A0ABU1NP14_9BACL|nr:RNA polymerase sigma-70 factor (ECF subfamily) [Paenibacillus qinlingensis]